MHRILLAVVHFMDCLDGEVIEEKLLNWNHFLGMTFAWSRIAQGYLCSSQLQLYHKLRFWEAFVICSWPSMSLNPLGLLHFGGSSFSSLLFKPMWFELECSEALPVDHLTVLKVAPADDPQWVLLAPELTTKLQCETSLCNGGILEVFH